MTTEQQLKALAELDGWKFEYGFNEHKTGRDSFGYSDNHGSVLHVPNYLTSYDAIIPLIQRLGKDVGGRVWVLVAELNLTYTPSQLAEALLRATGKWIE